MLPETLQEIVENFQLCQGPEKLEYLLEFAEKLPPLPAWLKEKQANMEQVHECMTPVFLFAEKLANGTFVCHFDIPPESPTVRGFASLLRQGTAGLTGAEILAIPSEFYLQLGLQQVISGQRLNGLGAMLAHIKRAVGNKEL